MDTYQDSLEVYDKLPFMDKKFVSPKEKALYRYVIKDKAFIDITPYFGNNDSALEYKKDHMYERICELIDRMEKE